MTTPKSLVLLALLSLGTAAHAADNSCAPAGGLDFVCGLKNPEDLVLVPGTKWIIASGMAAGAAISLIDTHDLSASGVYPGEQPQAKHDAASFPDCAMPPDSKALQTHGLNLRPGGAGHSTLYA